jgi:hypothetical protein
MSVHKNLNKGRVGDPNRRQVDLTESAVPDCLEAGNGRVCCGPNSGDSAVESIQEQLASMTKC